MVETRTLCRYDHARRHMSVPRHVPKSGVSWTARTAIQPLRTGSCNGRNPKSRSFPMPYLPRTGRTASSGFSMMRVCARVITLKLAKLLFPSSRHIKPGTCCPSCPSIDFIEEYSFITVLLHVRSTSISVLSVQNRPKSTVSLVKVAFPTVLERRNSRGRRLVVKTPFGLANDKGGCSEAIPLGLGTVPVSFPMRAGTTPKSRQSNDVKIWVNAVNGVNACG